MEASDLVKAGIADKRQNILKGFVNAEEVLKSEENNIEKAGHGIYGDNAQNRKLNRVGQEYGHAGKKEEGGQKKTKTEEQNDGEHKMTIEDHAKNTDSETLKKVVSNPKSDPALVAAAKRELTARGETHEHNEKVGKTNDENFEVGKSVNFGNEIGYIVGGKDDSWKLKVIHDDGSEKFYNNVKNDEISKRKQNESDNAKYAKDTSVQKKKAKPSKEKGGISELNDLAKKKYELEDDIVSMKREIKSKLSERVEINFEMEQEVDGDEKGNEYGEKLNKIDSEIKSLKEKIKNTEEEHYKIEEKEAKLWLKIRGDKKLRQIEGKEAKLWFKIRGR